MKKRNIRIKSLENEAGEQDLDNREFFKELEISLLLALLDNKRLNRCQFELCLREIERA